MSDKFQRSYELVIETIDGSTLTIKLPLTVDFDIERSTWSDANSATFTIYNLEQNNRDRIAKLASDGWDFRAITFYAGYAGNRSLVFKGNIVECFSVRRGTEVVTQVTANDALFAIQNTEISISRAKLTTREQVIKDILGQMTGVTIGAFGSQITGSLGRAASYSGNAYNILKQLTNGTIFIDNGIAHVLGDSECLPDQGVEIISVDTGLLNTPVREIGKIVCEVLFEPQIIAAQIISLTSVTEPFLNGDYKVIGFHHEGTISDAICGDAITTVELLAPLNNGPFAVVGKTA